MENKEIIKQIRNLFEKLDKKDSGEELDVSLNEFEFWLEQLEERLK